MLHLAATSTRCPPGDAGSILDAAEPPFSPGHVFGTDPVGIDIFSRILYGGQVSFEVGFAVTAIGMVDRRHARGHRRLLRRLAVDAVLSRVLDVLIAFPALVLALVIAEGLGPSEMHVIWALSVFSIPAFGRIARGATLTLREQTVHDSRPGCPAPGAGGSSRATSCPTSCPSS